jgi:hypothetical protein
MLLTCLSVVFLPPCVDRRLPLYPKALNVMKSKQLSVNMLSYQQTSIVKYMMISYGCTFRALVDVSSAATRLSPQACYAAATRPSLQACYAAYVGACVCLLSPFVTCEMYEERNEPFDGSYVLVQGPHLRFDISVKIDAAVHTRHVNFVLPSSVISPICSSFLSY